MAKSIVVHGTHIAKDFVPETFGRLTTIGPEFRMPSGKGNKYSQVVVCCCQEATCLVVMRSSLTTGNTLSCGCLISEGVIKRNTTHGNFGSLTHTSYRAMLQRCCDKNNKKYKDYGGRGIRVCDRWREPDGQGFLNFLADMGVRPSKGYSIHRAPADAPYSPEFCSWADQIEQCNNKRENRLLTHEGKTRTLAQWAREKGVNPSLISDRIKMGWDPSDALSTPPLQPGKRRK